MSTPTRVVNALNLGRAMAARVDTGDPGWTAWLFIRGVIARDQTWDALRETWAFSGTAARVYEPPRGFVIRYTRLSEAHLEAERRDDLDLAMRANPPEDWAVIAPDLEIMERVLRQFCPDLERIRLPAEVAYPEPPPRFAELRRLEDVLGPA